ncbi:MAG: flavin reductase family protein [Planctomycetes bacterium]|nr:flavin reductase family protein [Planctomycetota bacterium]
MLLDPTAMPPHQFYPYMIASINPRPIAWVSTLSPGGVTNLAPFSFFNGITSNPPALLFCPSNKRDGTKKDSLRNAEARGEFVVNVVNYDLAERMNATSAEYAYEVSEFERCGLTPAPSTKIATPRVAEAPVAYECRVLEIVRVGEGPSAGNVVIGRIEMLHVAETVLDAEGRIDPAKLDTIGRMGGEGYARTRERFDLTRPPKPQA